MSNQEIEMIRYVLLEILTPFVFLFLIVSVIATIALFIISTEKHKEKKGMILEARVYGAIIICGLTVIAFVI